MSTFKELVTTLGVNPNSITAKVGAVNLRINDHHAALTWFVRVKGIDLPFKLIRTISNESEVEAMKEFATNFQSGDYIFTSCEVRQKGESFSREDGTTGVYTDSYIAVPYLSNISYGGKTYILDDLRLEAEKAKIEMQKAMEL